MNTDAPEIGQVLNLLDRIRREWHAARILEGLATFFAVVFATTFALVLAALWLPLPAGVRWGLRAAWLAWLVLSVALLVFRRLFENPTEEQVALLVEGARPELHNEIINAVRLARDSFGQSRPFVKAAFRESGRKAARLNTRGIVSWRGFRRRTLTLGVLLLVCAAFVFGYPSRSVNALARLAFPRANLPKVGNVKIVEVVPGDVTVVAGENLDIAAVLEQTSDAEPAVRLQHFVADGPVHAEEMQPAGGNRFRCVLLDIRAPRTYRVAAGDSRSRDYRIDVTERPLVKRIAAAYRYPAYTGLAPDRVEDCGGVVRAVKGSTATLTITANKRLTSAAITLGDDRSVPLSLEPGRTTAVTRQAVEITDNASGQIEIEDEHRCRNSRPLRVIAVEDTAPRVKITAPGADCVLGVGESLQLAIRGNDDYGIVKAELIEKRVSPASGKVGEPEVVRTWNRFSDTKNVAIHWRWRFEKNSYRNGEIVRYFVRMVDGNDVGRSGVGTSAEFLVRLEDAAARQKERERKYGNWQAELEKVLKEQKELRGSTQEFGEKGGEQ